MLKYKDILDKLSAKQKIALITGIECLSRPEYAEAGLPHLEIATLDALLSSGGDGISAKMLARSWDTELVTELVTKLLENKRDSANLIIVPSPKIDFNGANKAALSEDALLASRMTAAYLTAVKNAGLIGVVPDFSLSKAEALNLDKKLDRRILTEFFLTPYARAVSEGEARAVIASLSTAMGEYENFNFNLIKEKDKHLPEGTYLLCRAVTHEETLLALDEGCILMSSAASGIENAHEQYLTIKAAIKKGRASMLTLEEACNLRTAISDEMLDDYADRVIEFVFDLFGQSVKNEVPEATEEPAVEPIVEATEEPIVESAAEATVEEAEPIAIAADEPVEDKHASLKISAIEKSTVLLKNEDDILPLGKRTKYAIIADSAPIADGVYDSDMLERALGEILPSQSYLGRAFGYDSREHNSEKRIEKALSLAKKADVTILLLKLERGARQAHIPSALPANQVALIKALSLYKKNVVAILPTDASISMDFSKNLRALILSPYASENAAAALGNVLTGRSQPTGKLTASRYDDPKSFFAKERFYKDEDRNKIGPFMGYRLYDSLGQMPTFAFGAGLSYSDVEYSLGKCTDTSVTFTVKNKSSSAVDEVLQVYVGKSDSAYVRPKKELKEFRTLHLKPHESKKITVDDFDFTVFDENSGEYVREGGDYTVYIGPSVSDIRLTASLNLPGDPPAPLRPDLSNYLQSYSNIVSNQFTLEAHRKRMNKKKDLKVSATASLILAILSALFVFVIDVIWIPIVISAAMLLLSIKLFCDVRSVNKKTDAAYNEITKNSLEEPIDAPADTKIDELFLQEFTAQKDDPDYDEESEDEGGQYDLFDRVNEDMTFTVARDEIKRYALGCGISITENTASTVLATLASTRLILANGKHGEELDAFVDCIAKYLKARLFTEEVTEAHSASDRLLRVSDEDGNARDTEVASAILSAAEAPSDIHIIYLKNIPTEKLSDFVTPYLRYFSNPAAQVKLSPKGATESYTLSSNIWFIAELAEGADVTAIPAFVSECAVMLPVQYDTVEIGESDEIEDSHLSITQADLEHLTENARNKLNVSEDVWKKIDAIEALVAKQTQYAIENKFWLQTETYLSVLLISGEEEIVAIDRALSSVLLPALTSVLATKVEDAEKDILDEVERLFGEENTALTRSMLNKSL